MKTLKATQDWVLLKHNLLFSLVIAHPFQPGSPIASSLTTKVAESSWFCGTVGKVKLSPDVMTLTIDGNPSPPIK